MGFYIDTSIWMDLYEDRKGYKNEPLGEYALQLFSLIKVKGHELFISDLLIKELEMNYSIAEIRGMIQPFDTTNITTKKFQKDKAKEINTEKNIPPGDVLHAILARDNNCTLIIRDKHFLQLKEIITPYKPEDII